MDTLTTTTTDQGPSGETLKEEEGSSPHTDDRGSPPPNCSICLGKCKNKCFTDSCFHQFCFKCLLQWSKIKADCPLCKQTFKSIIHNVRSNHQYDEYTVGQSTPAQEEDDFEIPSLFDSPRFRYRTTLTLHRRDSLAIQRILHQMPPSVDSLPRVMSQSGGDRATHRRTIYRHNLWAVALPDVTGRYRECSPEFYRSNPAQIHRLVPWLHRELMVLLNDPTRVAYVLQLITDTLPVYSLSSATFRILLVPFLGSRLNHFLHEFTSYATSPFDLVGYDRTVQYHPSTSLNMYSSSILSSDSDNSIDSDIMLVSPTAGPSQPVAIDLNTSTPASQPSLDNVIAIETISHSDTDDSSSEVMVVGFIKPPHERTPEVVDLLASDSDVILNEPEPEPEPPGMDRLSSDIEVHNSEGTPPGSMVKLKLKRMSPKSRRIASCSHWDEADFLSHDRTARKRRYVRNSASTSSAIGNTSDVSLSKSDTNLSPSDSNSSWLVQNRRKKLVTKKKSRIKDYTFLFGNCTTSNDSSDNRNNYNSSSDSDSSFCEPRKMRKKRVKKTQNKKTKKPQKKEVSKKRMRKKRSSSRESYSPRKRQRITKKKSREGKVTGRTAKAKARSTDQIKSSQNRLSVKKHTPISPVLCSLRREEQPSTSVQADRAEVKSNISCNGSSSKKRLKSVVNVVETPLRSGDTSSSLEEAQGSQVGGSSFLELMNNAALSNNANVQSYDSDSESCTLPEDVPLKYLFPKIKSSRSDKESQ